MLRSLRIEDLVLFEREEVHFHPGLNAITGETGSGKSALLRALHLIGGEKASAELVRHGAKRCCVEALFDIAPFSLDDSLLHLLLESGISCEEGEFLLLRRDIDASGKSRASINHQYVQQKLLQQVGGKLLHLVSQHASRQLTEVDYHRTLLDSFAGLRQDTLLFSTFWQQLKGLKKEQEELLNQEQKRQRQLETLVRECEEIESANLSEGEEEELFVEYSRLANQEKLQELIREATQLIEGDEGRTASAFKLLFSAKRAVEAACQLDSSLNPNADCLNQLLIELEELSRDLGSYSSALEGDHHTLQNLEERLKLIEKLKRKYGSSITEIKRYLKSAKEQLDRLHSSEEQLEKLAKQITVLEEKLNKQAQGLSEKRRSAAPKFARAIEKELAAMNMGKACFEVELTPCLRGDYGDEKVEFYLTPNKGEKRLPLKACASGGELSRMLLAQRLLLTEKEVATTLVFDEVDANIGGQTAACVGKKMAQLAERQQLLCVTHFAQVAHSASCHLKVEKIEEHGRTFTRVLSLDDQQRQSEFARMRGGV